MKLAKGKSMTAFWAKTKEYSNQRENSFCLFIIVSVSVKTSISESLRKYQVKHIHSLPSYHIHSV